MNTQSLPHHTMLRRKNTDLPSLICLLPGLGDALTASPIIRAAFAEREDVDALTMLPAVSEYCRGLGLFRNVIELPLLSRAGSALSLLAPLRRRYGTVVVPFPATRWQYAAVAAAIRPQRLVMHDYGRISKVIASTTAATLVKLRGGHRIAENARLADAITPYLDHKLEYIVPNEWQSERVAGVLGIHPGTMKYKGNESRRWPIENFIGLVKLNRAKGRQVRVFVGPQERDLVTAIADAVDNDVEFIDAPLKAAARAVSQCEVFVGNDAGMAHVAAGLGVKTITLFGMTDPLRAAPCGKTIVVKSDDCSPCHDEGSPDFRCTLNIGFRCLTSLSYWEAQKAIERAFEGDVSILEVQRSGPFRLYGQRYSA